MKYYSFLISLILIVALGFTACAQTNSKPNQKAKTAKTEVSKTPEEWKSCLTAEQYRVLREKGTERAFTGKFYNHHEEGTYTCAGCGTDLFSSTTKFDSGTGWPSYWQPINKKSVKTKTDKSYGMVRAEVVCGKCDGHLGHVFNDGPKPTGLRYCINSAALAFKKKEDKKESK